MRRVELLHEAKNILEMYGHILRKIKHKSREHNDVELQKVHEIIKNHRSKVQYLLDKVYNSLPEDSEDEQIPQ